MHYYTDKIETLCDVFGTREVALRDGEVVVSGTVYPILDDVIVLLEPKHWPAAVRRRLGETDDRLRDVSEAFSEAIQFTFGEEWEAFSEILPEHRVEFEQYFDLVDLAELDGRRICDLGCGIGRWSYFLAERCREVVAVDFSTAIFIARRNLAAHHNVLYFMADLRRLPFRRDFCDFLFCLGVLHHLPTDCLEEVKALRAHAPRLLVYLYYALDNRPFHFRVLFRAADALRRLVLRIRSPVFRGAFTRFVTAFGYYPFILLGNLLRPLGLAAAVPLWEGNHAKSFRRISQDVYDRFFTGIEQRVTRARIAALSDTFARVEISERIPYWHFLCER